MYEIPARKQAATSCGKCSFITGLQTETMHYLFMLIRSEMTSIFFFSFWSVAPFHLLNVMLETKQEEKIYVIILID